MPKVVQNSTSIYYKLSLIFIITLHSGGIAISSDLESCQKRIEEFNDNVNMSELFNSCNFVSENGKSIYFRYGSYNVFYVFDREDETNYYNIRLLVVKSNLSHIYFKDIKPYMAGVPQPKDFYKVNETKTLLYPIYSLKLEGPRNWATGFPQCYLQWPERDCRR